MERLQLDQLLWIPSATQPLKPSGASASNEQRAAMVSLAIAGRAGHLVDERELRRSGVSYSVDTVRELKQQYPEAELYLIIGSDSLASMPRWHQPAELLSLVTLAVVQRGGEDPLDFSVLEGIVAAERVEQFRQAVIVMPEIEISSSEIRGRVGQGRSIRHRVPRAVEAYIEANRLYR